MANVANQPTNGRTRRLIAKFLAEQGLLVMLLVLVVIFTALNPYFLTLGNIKNLLEQNATLAIIAVGMTFAIISKMIDLAPGSIIALSGVVIGLVFRATGNIGLGILAGLIVALGIDLFNGFLIARVGVEPLIVTLAAWIWARGLAFSLTAANSIVIQDPFIDFMNRPLVLGILPPLVLMALAYLVGWFLLNRTRLGRYTYAIGGDERAATQAGVDTAKYKILLFGFLGLLAGVGAIITVGRFGAAAPLASYGLELDAIVSVIIGGNPFQGGEGSLRKTFMGVLFIAVLNNGLNNLGMRDSYFYVYKGLAIILALFFYVISRWLARSQRPGASVSEPASL